MRFALPPAGPAGAIRSGFFIVVFIATTSAPQISSRSSVALWQIFDVPRTACGAAAREIGAGLTAARSRTNNDMAREHFL
jgi:hypothetical protein